MLPRRKFFLQCAGAVSASYAYACHWEPTWLEETVTTVPIGKGKLSRPLRIAHLSDLHASAEIPLAYLEQAFQKTVASKPDLICLTGDYVTTETDFDATAYTKILRILTSAAPTYAVFGNHDGGSWAAQSGWFPNHLHVESILVGAGIIPLHNTHKLVSTKAGAVRLVGLGDWWSEECLGADAFAGVPAGQEPVIVMNHNPDGKQECMQLPWELMLSGHTHGGQVIVPYYGPPVVPVIDKRFAIGLNPFDQPSQPRRWIFTTRGVGNIRGLRVNCRPELSTIVIG